MDYDHETNARFAFPCRVCWQKPCAVAYISASTWFCPWREKGWDQILMATEAIPLGRACGHFSEQSKGMHIWAFRSSFAAERWRGVEPSHPTAAEGHGSVLVLLLLHQPHKRGYGKLTSSCSHNKASSWIPSTVGATMEMPWHRWQWPSGQLGIRFSPTHSTFSISMQQYMPNEGDGERDSIDNAIQFISSQLSYQFKLLYLTSYGSHCISNIIELNINHFSSHLSSFRIFLFF